MALARVPVPVVAVVIGEGGSGGALAMCVADYVVMLENSYLSVIAPEACAAIIFRDPNAGRRGRRSYEDHRRDYGPRSSTRSDLNLWGGAHNELRPL
jgi:acetyl-CoA carboxylase carboxyltransferase component